MFRIIPPSFIPPKNPKQRVQGHSHLIVPSEVSLIIKYFSSPFPLSSLETLAQDQRRNYRLANGLDSFGLWIMPWQEFLAKVAVN